MEEQNDQAFWLLPLICFNQLLIPLSRTYGFIFICLFCFFPFPVLLFSIGYPVYRVGSVNVLAPIVSRPLEYFIVSAQFSPSSGALRPRTPIRSQPLQHLQLPSLRCTRTGVCTPGTPFLSRPLQHLKMSPQRSEGGSVFSPLTPVLLCPL